MTGHKNRASKLTQISVELLFLFKLMQIFSSCVTWKKRVQRHFFLNSHAQIFDNKPQDASLKQRVRNWSMEIVTKQTKFMVVFQFRSVKGCNKASFREKCTAILFKTFELNAYLESLNDVPEPCASCYANTRRLKVTDGTQTVLFLSDERWDILRIFNVP